MTPAQHGRRVARRPYPPTICGFSPRSSGTAVGAGPRRRGAMERRPLSGPNRAARLASLRRVAPTQRSHRRPPGHIAGSEPAPPGSSDLTGGSWPVRLKPAPIDPPMLSASPDLASPPSPGGHTGSGIKRRGPEEHRPSGEGPQPSAPTHHCPPHHGVLYFAPSNWVAKLRARTASFQAVRKKQDLIGVS